MQLLHSWNAPSVYSNVPAWERSWPLGSHTANSADVPGNVLQRKANAPTLTSNSCQTEPQLTSENQKFREDGHEWVVFYPNSSLELVPQSSEGFVVQIKLCETKKRVIPSDQGNLSALNGAVVVTAVRNGLFQLLLRDQGGNAALVAFHILRPDRGHKVLQFEDLRLIQIPRFVCLKVVVTRNNHNQPLIMSCQIKLLVIN